MERNAPGSAAWTFKAYTADGKLLATCLQQGYSLSCDKTGFITP